MSAMEAFHSTWLQAKDTFGSGTPADGSEYDNSAKLRQLQSNVAAAKPDDRWQSPAADAYAAKNEKHAATYGKLAYLDQRMAAEVGKTTSVVTAGRQNLDQLQDWARSAAASVPNGQNAGTMKMIIASKGISQISEIVQKSSDQMAEIGERIRGIGKEYKEIGGDKGKEKSSDLGNWKEDPPIWSDDDDRTFDEKVADWLIKVNDLNKEMDDLWRTRPPDGTPDGPIVEAWHARRREILKKQAELVQEGAELGIGETGAEPPTAQTPSSRPDINAAMTPPVAGFAPFTETPTGQRIRTT